MLSVGAPEVVRNDPRVIASYLGTDERAIQRSGAGMRSCSSSWVWCRRIASHLPAATGAHAASGSAAGVGAC